MYATTGTVSPSKRASELVATQIAGLLAQVEATQAENRALRLEAEARRHQVRQVEHELTLAGRLQADFLPKRLPNQGRVKFNRLFRPASRVSGDLYDIRRLDEKHVGVFLVDAMGHGMPAALLVMFVQSVLRPKRINGDGTYELVPSAEVMRQLNDALLSQNLAHSTFATAVYARVNVETCEVDLARGGHPLPLLVRAGGKLEEIETEGALLGVLPDEQFDSVSLTLEPGDKLIFYSDGMDIPFAPREAPANGAWLNAVQLRKDLCADDLLLDIWQHLETRGEVADDVTLVTLEVPE
jgi:sigma-B regulation protein RsbU (phosphoserine phosphatase)